jgi:hypothetical protein
VYDGVVSGITADAFPEEGAFNDVVDTSISDHVEKCVDSFVTALFFVTPEFWSVVGCVDTASPP